MSTSDRRPSRSDEVPTTFPREEHLEQAASDLATLPALLLASAVAVAQSLAPAVVTVGKHATTNVRTATGAPGPDIVGRCPPRSRKPKRTGSSPLRRDPVAGEVFADARRRTPTSSGKKAKSSPEVILSFEGVNHRNQRLRPEHQFSGEPADLGLLRRQRLHPRVRSIRRCVSTAPATGLRSRPPSRRTSSTASRLPSTARRAFSGRSRSTSAAITIRTPTAGSTSRWTSTRTR